MITAIKKPWVEVGYEIFASEGPNGLKVERLARLVHKNKSSFYHHFADLEVFTEHLLAYHLERSRIIAVRESQCKNVVPELLEVILEFKQDLFFNRQLRIHRNIESFRICFEKSSAEVGEAILDVWAETLGIGGNSHLAQMVLNLSLENFYLQITPATLNYDWLVAYIENLKAMIRAFEHKA